MPVYEKNTRKIHFIHTPKTGGMYIRNALDLSGWNKIQSTEEVSPGVVVHGHMPYKYWSLWSQAKNVDFEFAFVRNPYQRFISHVNMTINHQYERKVELLRDVDYLTSVIIDEDRTAIEECHRFFEDTEMFKSMPVNIRGFKIEKLVDAMGKKISKLSPEKFVEHDAKLKKNHGNRYIKDQTGKEPADMSWADIMKWYLGYWDKETGGDYEVTGAVPCPANLYLSPQTKIYKLEDGMSAALKDLSSNDILIQDYDYGPKINSSTYEVKPGKNFSWDSHPDLKNRFFKLYQKDFEDFGYDFEDVSYFKIN
jgi:hypothetical protein